MAERVRDPDPPSDLPLRLDEAADFTRVRRFFREAGFRPEPICAALQIDSLAALPTVRSAGFAMDGRCTAALGLLIRLFLLGVEAPVPEVGGIIGPETLRALQALDLLRAAGGEPEPVWFAPVCLYPVGEDLIASDLVFSHAATPCAAHSEMVYPAFTRQTGQFLRVIGRSPAEAALDLCTGSGAAALLLSRSAAQAVAVDITGRSAHFARFNRLLNGAGNMEVLQGNLYKPVAGRSFDRIVAHPSYAPATGELTGLAGWRRLRRGGPAGDHPGTAPVSAAGRGLLWGRPGHGDPGAVLR